MTNGMDDRANSCIMLHDALGRIALPDTITQEATHYPTTYLRDLVGLKPGERADGRALMLYMLDVRHAEVQVPLFIYLLPFCLEAWREDLRGVDGGYGVFVEEFYPTMAEKRVFDVYLTPKQGTVVSDFMRLTILEEIDDQRGLAYRGAGARPYRWIYALTTYGVLCPDMDRLWTAWWSMGAVGPAVATVQYISCLMYREDENPVFVPSTREAGGGPPCLWVFEGHLYHHCWIGSNIDFLKQTLVVNKVKDALYRATDRLVNLPEHDVAMQVCGDFESRAAVIAARCAELSRMLGTTSEPGRVSEWSS